MQAAAELLLTGVSTLCFTPQFLPEPVLKLQKSLRLPNSALSLRLRYEAPLEALDDPFRPPARLLVRCVLRLHFIRCQLFRQSVAAGM